MEPNEILAKIESACAGGISAIRAITRLTPIANGDKVFPPTYASGEQSNAPPVYHKENRLIDGEEITVVVLDSVQSQANRLEQNLLKAFDDGECPLPLLFVTIPGHGRITALDAPHRVHDAIFRDSLYKEENEEKTPFRESTIGKKIVNARANNARGFYEFCPTALILGTWDSTAGEGTRGAKIQRALTSEITGVRAVPGNRSSSRVDPLGIQKDAGPIYKHETDYWTLNADDPKVVKKDGIAVPFGKKDKAGKPSAINHGNILPVVVKEIGGVTVSEAIQTIVLSFVQLRRLHFPESEVESKSDCDTAGRAVLATLSLYAITLQMEEGYDLRSRCQLIPIEQPQFQFVGPTATDVQTFTLDRATAKELFVEACKKAEDAGLKWRAGLIELSPSEKLLELVRRSDAITEPAEG